MPAIRDLLDNETAGRLHLTAVGPPEVCPVAGKRIYATYDEALMDLERYGRRRDGGAPYECDVTLDRHWHHGRPR
jgi:hypothetical protein